MNKRNDIYVIKAMGIILVVYMHSFLFLYSEWDHMTNIIIQWIESFFMPLFFIACGMGMKDRYEVIISFSNIKVMVVYVIWAFIYLNNRDIHSYFGILYGTNKVLGVIGTNAVLWFIPTFVLASMIYKTILKFSTSDVLYSALVCGCVCVGFLGGGYSRNTNVGILWGADIALVTCGFIAIGHKVLKNSKLSMKKYVIIIFLIIGVILSCQNGKHVEMAHSYYGNSYILFYITALLNCFTICIVAKWVQRSKVLVYIGKNTLFIMCVHYIIYDFTVPIVKMLIAHTSFPQIFGSLLNCILTFMLICPLMYAREKIVELYKN